MMMGEWNWGNFLDELLFSWFFEGLEGWFSWFPEGWEAGKTAQLACGFQGLCGIYRFWEWDLNSCMQVTPAPWRCTWHFKWCKSVELETPSSVWKGINMAGNAMTLPSWPSVWWFYHQGKVSASHPHLYMYTRRVQVCIYLQSSQNLGTFLFLHTLLQKAVIINAEPFPLSSLRAVMNTIKTWEWRGIREMGNHWAESQYLAAVSSKPTCKALLSS